uniref:Protein kinase domain-containing protein n=1 Tax=Acrobeloides nanus TaxID=290746 RepID=A0A914C5P6_9BILA
MDEGMKKAAKILNVHLTRNVEGLNLPIGKFKNELVAILRYSCDPCSSERIREELDILRPLDHKNVQKLIESTTINEDYFICVLLMDLGSLKHAFLTAYPKGIPEAAISLIVRQLIDALAYIHDRQIIHRSVQCSHILLGSSGLVRLAGFHHSVLLPKCNRWIGIETQIHAFDESLEDSFSWLAPELLRQDINGYSYNSDVYSLGITICEMGNGFPPFEEMEPLQILYEKFRGSTPFLLDAQTCPADSEALKIPSHEFSGALHDLVQKCLTSQPTTRPTSIQLLEHPFLRVNNTAKTFQELLPALKPL